MVNNRSKLLDTAHANYVATKPVITEDQIPEPDRVAIFFVTTSDMQSSVPPAPSLFHYVAGAFGGVPQHETPSFIDGMEMLGKLAMLAPVENGNMMANFILPPGHPDAPEEETAHILTLPVTTAIVDAFVNSGTLTGLDNIVYGRSEDGVLFEVAVYIEIDG